MKNLKVFEIVMLSDEFFITNVFYYLILSICMYFRGFMREKSIFVIFQNFDVFPKLSKWFFLYYRKLVEIEERRESCVTIE